MSANIHPEEDGAVMEAKSGTTFFICWEGEKDGDFSFVQRMKLPADDDGTLLVTPAVRWTCSILPEKTLGARHYRTSNEHLSRRRSEASTSDGFPGLSSVHSYRSGQADSGSTRSNAVNDKELEIQVFQNAVSSLSVSEQVSPDMRGHLLLSSIENWKSLDGRSSPEWDYQGASVRQQLCRTEYLLLGA